MTEVLERTVEGLPIGRGGRWRFVLRRRDFDTTTGARPAGFDIAELVDARSRRFSRELNKPASLTFSIPGDSDAAYLIRELEHEVLAYRYGEATDAEQLMFRGPVHHTQDIISEQVHTLNVTCYDYLALLARRYVIPGNVSPWSFVLNTDQDQIVINLLNYAQGLLTGWPGATGYQGYQTARLGLWGQRRNPDGSIRGTGSGRIRSRDYPVGSNIAELIDNLANVIDGFDYDVRPAVDGNAYDSLNIYYPYQGIDRTAGDAFVFEYGVTVSSLSRAINANYFANSQFVVGQAEQHGAQPPVSFAKAASIQLVGVHPEGMWDTFESASDVKEAATLAEKAAGNLARSYPLTPSYSLSLRPAVYRVERASGGSTAAIAPFDIGDRVRLRISRGRLDLETWVRVLGITHVIGDDGQEDVDVTVGQVLPTTFPGLFAGTHSRLLALERR